MHTKHLRSISISSPIEQTYPNTSLPLKPLQKARRPSVINSMSSFKDTIRGRIDNKLQEVYDKGHRRIHSNGSRRARSPVAQGLVISEPRLNTSDPNVRTHRPKPLGSGAIEVRTPADALALYYQRGPLNEAASSSTPENIFKVSSRLERVERNNDSCDTLSSPSLRTLPASTPTSPVLQPRKSRKEWEQSRRSTENNYRPHDLTPLAQIEEPLEENPQRSRRNSPLSEMDHLATLDDQTALEDIGAESDEASTFSRAPIVERASPRQSSSGSSTTTSGSAGDEGECFASAPRLPYDLASALPQPSFEPVLMSNLSANLHQIDQSKLIVVLETETTSFRSSYKTLTARPSYLAAFLAELIQSTVCESPVISQTPCNEERDVDSESTYSQELEEDVGGFNSIFQNHLAATGVLSDSVKRKADATGVIRVFLDRKSEPYSHIMTYLRAPALPNYPKGMLPYAARLFPAAKHSFATKRLESLLDLRDEASYLGLLDLVSLCDTELAGQVPIVAPHTERNSTSVNSGFTLIDSTINSLIGEGKGGARAREVTAGTQAGGVDIPVVLPAPPIPLKVPPKVPKIHKEDLDGTSYARLERRAGHIAGERVLNASQLRAQARTKPQGNYI